jgi:hypothetical protein
MTGRPSMEETWDAWLKRVPRSPAIASVRTVFPGVSPLARAHHANCRLLLRRGMLIPEVDDGMPPHNRALDLDRRYYLVE